MVRGPKNEKGNGQKSAANGERANGERRMEMAAMTLQNARDGKFREMFSRSRPYGRTDGRNCLNCVSGFVHHASSGYSTIILRRTLFYNASVDQRSDGPLGIALYLRWSCCSGGPWVFRSTDVVTRPGRVR